MNKSYLMLVLSLFFIVDVVGAREDNLKMHFDFSKVSGVIVTDVVGGINARMQGVAKVEQVGKYHALDLGNGTGYMNMTSVAGTLLKNMGDFTISACYRVDDAASLSGNGYFLWSFSSSSACTETEGKYIAYRLNAQRMATSTGGFGSESGVAKGTESDKGRWINVTYRQSGTKGELFIDGDMVEQNTNMPVPKEVFTSTPVYCWIGRAPFSDDSYLTNTMVADIRLYDAAISDEDVEELVALAEDLEREYNYGIPGDFTSLQAKVEECKTFLEGDVSGYAPNAIAELQDQTAVADKEVQSARTSQILIDKYLATLEQLLANAKATNGYAPKRTFEVVEDHGFVHPGGIVSQEDIDRAKKLLADGDERITRAWDILCSNQYSSSTIATWPVETIVRGGTGTQNYINVARGAAMAFQNALRWKIAGTRENADAAVRILMAWARGNKWVSGDSNLSLAAGIYGYELANAAELMRDYDGWQREDFEEFRQYMLRTWYNPAIDFLRRRHDTWVNFRHSNVGQRPGHYWSNWGLCNALCVMSIGILCDDVHMYNQGVSFYKYDHVGTYQDRSNNTVIVNDGCNEFLGNLVPVVLPDERGPFGFLGQMQESGRDQGHSLFALGLALDICQVGLTQGDDLYAYMDDRIAAGTEFVAAFNFGGVPGSSLPWIEYNYSDCGGWLGYGWAQTAPNEGGKGEYRPFWDRAIGYYEGLRGVKLQYAEMASAAVCPDGGGGNYGQHSGGFDHLGFSTLTSWRPAVTAEEAITPLSGDIIYHGETLKNQTNLGGLKYIHEVCPSKGIPADGSDIVLIPQLPDGAVDSGIWQWDSGETSRQITVKADHSYIYRVTYTAPNGAKSRQAFAIAVSGDARPDLVTNRITLDGTTSQDTLVTVLSGSDVVMSVEPTTGWTNDYLWDNGNRSNTVTITGITTSRTYTCQYANQSGAVSESRFHIDVAEAQQFITTGDEEKETDEVQVLWGAEVTLRLVIPSMGNPDDVVWQNGERGLVFSIPKVVRDMEVSAVFEGNTYTFHIYVKAADYDYYDLLTTEKGYRLVSSVDDLAKLSNDYYFVLASDQADLLIGLKDAPNNGNKALFFQTPVDPLTDLSKVFTIETYGDAFCLRNIDYDGLLLQTEWDRPYQLRTHDQPLACEWTRLLFSYDDDAWTVENGMYTGNWLGLWTPANGYRDGEEMACNKTGDDICRLQIFAIEKKRFHRDYLPIDGVTDATPLIVNPQFIGNGMGWTMTGTWGNQRYNGAVEVWHSTDFNFSQTLTNLPDGVYSISCQMVNGEGSNTGYLYVTSGSTTKTLRVFTSCAGSNFDAERDKMAANARHGLMEIQIDVTGGTLTFGITEPSADTTWLVWDNFKLVYKGYTGIEKDDTVIDNTKNIKPYDPLGRRILTPLENTIYIKDGKKYRR